MENGFGTRGVSAEKVAEKICDAVVRFMSTDVPVGDCLADQLLLPMALSGGGAMRFTATTSHFLTNLQTIRAFIPFEAELQRESRLAWRLRAGCPFTISDCQ
jgi:RNA 3'-terminal phosphate cyclase (ATP)